MDSGLRLVSRFPERFRGVVISNTALPIGGSGLNEAFEKWASQLSHS